jgi:hypothetical protein
MTKFKFDYTCKECGSSDLIFDALAAWDVEHQRFELVNVFEMPVLCRYCEYESPDVLEVPADQEVKE